MANDPLRPYYTRARNRLRKHSPDTMLAHGIGALHKVHAGGVAVMRHYQPWNILLLLKWAMQEADGVSHRRPAATLDDFHAVLNILHEADGNVRMPSDYEHVYLFMRQLAFQQFWLQQAACGESLVRQDLLFSALPADHWLQRQFRRLTGVSPGEFLDLAYATFTLILQTPSPEFIERHHYDLIAPGLSPGALDGFLRHLSRRGEELHTKLSQPPYSGMSVADQQVLPTPLLDSPLLQTATGSFVVISPTLLMRSLESAVYRTLRRNDPSAFGPRFGPVFERYVGRVLDSAKVDYFDETRLQGLLPGTGKCVDFLIHEADATILIDAKGIELSALGRVSQTGELLFRTIKDSAVKAIEQGMETLRRIHALPADSAIADRDDEKFVIVVTFDDLFLGSNYEFGALFGSALVPRLQNQFGGTLPLPMEHVFFLSIDEFERLLVRLEGGANTIGSILRHARSNDADGRTRKFHFIQHLESIAKQSKRLPILQAGLETLCDRCIGRVPPEQRKLRP
jgi:hypothetical protein